MQRVLSGSWKWLNSKSVKAGLLLGIFLSVLALAQVETLHHAIHRDAGERTHECAVTLLAAGKVFLTEGATAIVVAELPFFVEVQLNLAPDSAASALLPLGRAPPVLFS